MSPPARWTQRESPVKPVLSDAEGGVEGPANDDGCFGGRAPPPVTPARWGGRRRRYANA